MTRPQHEAERGPSTPPARSRALTFWYPSYLGGTAPASSRYRIGNLVELARRATVAMGGRVGRRALDGCHALIVSRPRTSLSMRAVAGRCVRAGVIRVGDFDDYLFTEHADQYPTVLSGRESASQAQARARRHRKALDQFDLFTAATPTLAEALREVAPGAPVYVVPNGLSASWVERGRTVYPSWTPGDPRVIRYLPGSTHDADFALIAPVLRRFLWRHPAVHLEIVGPLRWDPEGFPADRVHHHPMVPFDHLPRYVASSWVTVAPLVDNEFNRCKSSIKFLEAGAFGCPTVASPIPAMRAHERGGILLADGNDAWEEALEALRDDAFRMDRGARARAHVDRHGMATHSMRALEKALDGASDRGVA